MGMFRKLPVTIEAVQFTGDNWAEMHEFTGHRLLEGQTESDGRQAHTDVFDQMGTHLVRFAPDDSKYVGELWVEANQAWLPIEVGEWVLQDKIGFYPCKDEIFQLNYVTEADLPMLFDGMDDTGIPVLHENSEETRMLGRIRMALMMTRPLVEVDLISEAAITWLAEARLYRALSNAQKAEASLSFYERD